MYLLKHKKTSMGITLDTLIRIKFCCLNFGRMAEPCAVRGRLGQHMRLEPAESWSSLPVFSLISQSTLKRADFIRWQFRACFLKGSRGMVRKLAHGEQGLPSQETRPCQSMRDWSHPADRVKYAISL